MLSSKNDQSGTLPLAAPPPAGIQLCDGLPAMQAMRVVKPGGMLMTCSCSGAVTLDDHFIPMLKVTGGLIVSDACSPLLTH